MNKLTTPTITHDNASGGTNDTPRAMDDLINKLCQENGLIKEKLLEAIGSSTYRYASKLKFKGLSPQEISSLSDLLFEIASKAEDYSQNIFSMVDHYSGVQQIADELKIKKKIVIEMMKKDKSYFSGTLRRQRRLANEDAQAISEGLARLAENIKRRTQEVLIS